MATSSEPARRHADAPRRPGVDWDDANMQTAYANVCNVAGTREEVVVVFGTRRASQGGPAPASAEAARAVSVDLSHKIILGPFAAKRLARLLNGVLEDYERRYGELSLGPRDAEPRGSRGGPAF